MKRKGSVVQLPTFCSRFARCAALTFVALTLIWSRRPALEDDTFALTGFSGARVKRLSPRARQRRASLDASARASSLQKSQWCLHMGTCSCEYVCTEHGCLAEPAQFGSASAVPEFCVRVLLRPYEPLIVPTLAGVGGRRGTATSVSCVCPLSGTLRTSGAMPLHTPRRSYGIL